LLTLFLMASGAGSPMGISAAHALVGGAMSAPVRSVSMMAPAAHYSANPVVFGWSGNQQSYARMQTVHFGW